ncbi:MAG: hypothetical protein LUH42_04910 [Oscillospiraceae bacterium]|nr:hypothetical protein [Oscillospiraceae bacterium]
MNKKMPKMPGLWVPRIIILLRGFFAGRIGAAAIDQDSGKLNSAYLNGKLFRFLQFCHEWVAHLERDSAGIRTEAAALLQELKGLPLAAAQDDVPTPIIPTMSRQTGNGTRAEAQAQREAARAATAAAAAQSRRRENADKKAARRQEILNRLGQIRDRITTRERLAQEQMGAASDALSSRFSAYACGALLKPFSADVIPQLDYHSHLEDYYAAHAQLMETIDAARNEEVLHDYP